MFFFTIHTLAQTVNAHYDCEAIISSLDLLQKMQNCSVVLRVLKHGSHIKRRVLARTSCSTFTIGVIKELMTQEELPAATDVDDSITSSGSASGIAMCSWLSMLAKKCSDTLPAAFCNTAFSCVFVGTCT